MSPFAIILGWIILGAILAVFSTLIALFPKTLPRAAVRKAIAQEKNKGKVLEEDQDVPASFRGKFFCTPLSVYKSGGSSGFKSFI